MPVRLENRFASNVGITLPQGKAVSRNVSASGIYFETAAALRDGERLSFTMDLNGPDGRPVRMRCIGHVVRIEPLGGKWIGVGARIDDMKLEHREADA